ncbi:MAG: methyltransferase domain-containing protein [Planctomycetes bacterium]|nr:methyltransferase domain-containing protein [Planctomycetota bacterium]
MRAIDRLLQAWRISKAKQYVRAGDRLLDVGCFDQRLLDKVASRIASGVGIDPYATPLLLGNIEVVRGWFPNDLTAEAGQFDCISMLAVMEHVERPEEVARECFRLLRPGGRVVITAPRALVDKILAVLFSLRLIDGIHCEQHHGYEVDQTRQFFEDAGFVLNEYRTFQLGLNCLFVFEKPMFQAEVAGGSAVTDGFSRLAG